MKRTVAKKEEKVTWSPTARGGAALRLREDEAVMDGVPCETRVEPVRDGVPVEWWEGKNER